MRKFTLYQAARFTKISRYKLEQAISDGFLKCIEGKGNVKCFIMEDELSEFMKNHGEQYKRFQYPEERSETVITEDFNLYIQKEIHNQIIAEKNRVIDLLEFQNQQLMPLVEKSGSSSLLKISELKTIALSAINELPESKSEIRQNLAQQINKI